MHVSGHGGTLHSSVTANMNLIGERFLWYRYIVSLSNISDTAVITVSKINKTIKILYVSFTFI